ncbi:MAG: universal stress protein [Pseudomonadales bacterium]|nr:universal stress protein [Pseudomonadales bacterium]MBL6816775.1 universal stress protein [Pseudomonadales bacterium]
MSEINHILVPTDGSQGAINAAAYAGQLAKALGANITILCVQSDDHLLASAWGAGEFYEGVPGGMKSVDEIRGVMEKQVQEKELPDTSRALGEVNSEPQLVTVWGHPAEEIVKYVKENAVDLVIMGSHGRTGIKRAFLGSVSQAVANQVDCPVTLVK